MTSVNVVGAVVRLESALMTVVELIQHLKNFATLSPENGLATVFLRAHDHESCHEIATALDGKGMPGQHYLILVPTEKAVLKMREAMRIH